MSDAAGPIAAADARVLAWARATVGEDVALTVGVPDESAGPGIMVCPMGLDAAQELRCSGSRAPLRFRVQYFVATTGPDDAAVSMLDDLLLAAVNASDMGVSFEPVPMEWWTAMGARPRRGFVVEVPAQVLRRHERTSQVVTRPIKVEDGAVRSLSGRVVGPGDVPIAGARVELGATRAYAHTGPGGAFRFAMVPDIPGPTRLRIRAKGLDLEADIDAAAGEDVVIRCEPGEA